MISGMFAKPFPTSKLLKSIAGGSMYTVKEVASKLKISVGAVYKAIASADLECYRFGKTIRISQEQLNEFLECSTSCEAPQELSRSLKHL